MVTNKPLISLRATRNFAKIIAEALFGMKLLETKANFLTIQDCKNARNDENEFPSESKV